MFKVFEYVIIINKEKINDLRILSKEFYLINDDYYNPTIEYPDEVWLYKRIEDSKSINKLLNSICIGVTLPWSLNRNSEKILSLYSMEEYDGTMFTLGSNKKPHNPFTLPGALLTSAHLKTQLTDSAAKIAAVLNIFAQAADIDALQCSMGQYLRYKENNPTKERGIAYWMKNIGILESDVEPEEVIEVLHQIMSIEMDIELLGIIAGTLANQGINPLSSTKVFDGKCVARCLDGVIRCGLEADSPKICLWFGGSGCAVVVIPGVLGIGIYSHGVNDRGVSSSAYEFVKAITQKYPSFLKK